ncbi:MAG: hypothetical protein JSW10_02260 [Pseudomonadota bacterium]|nr:MAG: hypothetical protein JSW10_02260 [Pseudomonadota bacterium]
MVIHSSGLFLVLVCLIAAGALGWLIAVARRERAGTWPYKLALSPLLPFYAVQFAIEYWNESARPFVLFVSSWLVAAVLVVVMLVGGDDAPTIATPDQAPAGKAVQSAQTPPPAEPEPGSYAYLVQQARQMHEMGLFTDQQLELELAALREEYGISEDEPMPRVDETADAAQVTAEEEPAVVAPAAEFPSEAAAPAQATPADEEEEVQALTAMSGVEPSVATPQDEPAASASSDAPADTEAAPPARRPTVAKQDTAAEVTRASAGREITYEEAVNYVGREMSVLTNNGVRHEVRLVDLEGSALVFERRMVGGAVSFELTRNDIRVIRLK